MKQSRGAKRAALRLLSRWMAREVRDARRRWAEGLQRGRTWLMVPVTVASMYVLWHWAFGLGFYFGVSFLIAATLTLLRGHIFTHPFRLFLVAVAVVIGTLIIPSLSGDAWQAFRRGDTLTALVLVALILLSWLAKKYLETGQKGVSVPVSTRGGGRTRRPARRR